VLAELGGVGGRGSEEGRRRGEEEEEEKYIYYRSTIIAANAGCDDPANTFAFRICFSGSIISVGGVGDDVFGGWCGRGDGWEGGGK